jgi:phenylalanyl-tRNA synthetase alpha chain
MNITETLSKAALAAEAAEGKSDLEAIRVTYLGKKGEITSILKGMGQLPPEERAKTGKEVNEARAKIEAAIAGKLKEFQEKELRAKFEKEKIDVTEPGLAVSLGKAHPITKTINEVSEIFMSIGYSVAEGPEIETVENNFDALNAPKNHPSREMSDTFYITDDILLRTQTSPVQIRTLKKGKLPIKVIAPGRCFRTDTPDATHSPMFHQVEGLLVDENVTLADLKGTLDFFAKKMFGGAVKTRFRPHYFPFTEPSCEMDMSCFSCGGKGCPICKGSGWIEILGCGMVHPNVLAVGGVDTEKYTGFAFGLGVERVAMLKYGIDDIRLFYENDVRFLGEF